MRVTFRARHPGHCGICTLKIYPGDKITMLDTPVQLNKRVPINPIHATTTRTHYQKIIVCNYGHAQCAGKERWNE